MASVFQLLVSLGRVAGSAYSASLERHPLLTEMSSSGLLWCLGDIATQLIERRMDAGNNTITSSTTTNNTSGDDNHKPSSQQLTQQQQSTIDWKRTFYQTVYASMVWGPLAHQWYIWLDHWVFSVLHVPVSTVILEAAAGGVPVEVLPPTVAELASVAARHAHEESPATLLAICIKFVIEMIWFHPMSLVAYFLVMGWLTGSKLRHTLTDLHRDFVTTYAFEIAFWIPIDFGNFALVPVRHQLLVVNCACFVDSIVLSYVKHNGTDNIRQQVVEWCRTTPQSRNKKDEHETDDTIDDDLTVEMVDDLDSDCEKGGLMRSSSEENIGVMVKRRAQ